MTAVDSRGKPALIGEEQMLRNSGDQTRLLLLVGFGGLLLLLAAVGLNSLSVLESLQHRNEQIRGDYLHRERILEQLRSEIYLSGTYVRDLLLEPDPARANFHRGELERSRSHIRSLVVSYNSIILPEEHLELNRFRRELDGFFHTLEPALTWNADQRLHLGYAFMQNSLLPGRMAVVHLTDQLKQVNERQLAESSRRVEQLFAQFRSRLLFLLFLTLSVGLLLALFSFRRILKLERETSDRFVEAVQARTALRDLSSRVLEMQENERKAISRELHDEVGQSLSGVLLGIANLAESIAPLNDTDVERQLHKLRRLTERTVSTVRDMSLLLRPSMLDDLGLVPALQWQAREISRNSALNVTVEADSIADDLSDEQKTCIYRVVQEALRNSVRHAHATAVAIKLKQIGSQLVLAVDDDGRGFNPQVQKGLGLLGMEERVRHLGGTFVLHSSSEAGSHIQVQIPSVHNRELSLA